MKIGVADRNGLLDHCDLNKLREAGVTALEYYCPINLRDPWYSRIEEKASRVAGSDFEIAVHLTGDIWSDLESFQTLTKVRLLELWGENLTTVVFHPCEHWPNRFLNCVQTEAICKVAAEAMNPIRYFCLENLPVDLKVPQRYGDMVDEVDRTARATGIRTCFDTGHYMASWQLQGNQKETFESARGDRELSPFERMYTDRIQHIHLNASVEAQEHQPLVASDTETRDLIWSFNHWNPDFDGIWSLEIDTYKPSVPQEVVLESLAVFQEWITNPVTPEIKPPRNMR